MKAGCAVAKEQIEADDDTTGTQRMGMVLGTGLKECSSMVDNDVAKGSQNYIHVYN